MYSRILVCSEVQSFQSQCSHFRCGLRHLDSILRSSSAALRRVVVLAPLKDIPVRIGSAHTVIRTLIFHYKCIHHDE